MTRRRALSGCESPRAPNAETQWEVLSPEDISPLPPLEDMLDYQEQQEQEVLAARQQQERHQTAKAQRDRRRALSSCDSPRAPSSHLHDRQEQGWHALGFVPVRSSPMGSVFSPKL